VEVWNACILPSEPLEDQKEPVEKKSKKKDKKPDVREQQYRSQECMKWLEKSCRDAKPVEQVLEIVEGHDLEAWVKRVLQYWVRMSTILRDW